jgi:uncharacterized membrane protein
MKQSTFDGLLSFLSGVSWAFVIVGAWVTFQSFVFLGIVPAIMFTFVFIFLALFLILVLESISKARDNHEMMIQQTALLEEIRESIKTTASDA